MSKTDQVLEKIDKKAKKKKAAKKAKKPKKPKIPDHYKVIKMDYINFEKQINKMHKKGFSFYKSQNIMGDTHLIFERMKNGKP